MDLPAGLDEWGTRILQAIDQLSGRIEKGSSPTSSDDSLPTVIPSNSLGDEEIGPLCISVERRTPITSISSIMDCNVFGSGSSCDAARVPSFSRQPHRSPNGGYESGTTAVPVLTNLLRCYVSYYQSKIEILDIHLLKGYVAQIGENGAEWTAESCLVFLVAALGSICQASGYLESPNSLDRSPDAYNVAFRYWNMAKKRLGWALENNNLLSTQCLCLTGIWRLQTSDPFSA
ncbi:hypothetical protein V491_04557 [Pseudogymnoascus sp. VKM F-3775]|nr:hypothetical protein V491_04557 [Pseudogymnoascus sp. VKM F-3775]